MLASGVGFGCRRVDDDNCPIVVVKARHLVANMKVLYINGCDCAEMMVGEAMLMIASTIGEVTIVAAHANVLFMHQPLLPATMAQSSTSLTDALVAGTATTSAALTTTTDTTPSTTTSNNTNMVSCNTANIFNDNTALR